MNNRSFGYKETRVVLALVACAQLIFPGKLLAQVSSGNVPMQPAHTSEAAASTASALSTGAAGSASANAGKINFDLSSTVQSVSAGNLPNFSPTTIVVNGQNLNVNAQTMLTPGQAAAVMQMIHTGAQAIVLGASGNALGGSVTISPRFAQNMANFVIPQGVTAIDRITNSGTFNFAGNIANAGSMYAVSTNNAINNATINAVNIANLPGGLISTVLPAGGLAGITGALSSLNLDIRAVNNIVNAGAITSSGNLSLTAGGSITNANNAVISAINNVNLASAIGNFVNGGLIAAQIGNINFSTGQMIRDLTISNLSGTLHAPAGQINIRDALFTGHANINLTGGDWLSKELNLYGGAGKIIANLGNVTGLVNASACDGSISVSAPNASIGNWIMSGDPVFTNNAGNVTLSGAITGSDLIVAASNNILGNAGSPPSINVTGGIVMVAGTSFIDDGLSTVRFTGRSGNGGNIDLSNFNNGGGLNSGGGNVTLAAYAAAAGSSTGGHITLPSTNLFTGGGNVSLFAEGAGTAGMPVSIASSGINTIGGAAGSGQVTMITATPSATALAPVVVDRVTGALRSGTFIGGTPQDGAISAGAITTGGGAVRLLAGTNNAAGAAIAVTSIQTTPGASGAGGDVVLLGGINGTGSADISSGQIITSPIGANAGGSVQIVTPGSINQSGSLTTGAPAGTAAGSLLLVSGITGRSTSLVFGNISTVAAVNGGNVEIVGMGSPTPINSAGSSINTSATSAAGVQAGSVTISSTGAVFVGSVTAANNGTSPTSFGGDVLIATNSNGGASDISIGSGSGVIDTSTAGNGAHGAGQIYLIARNASPSTIAFGSISQNCSACGGGSLAPFLSAGGFSPSTVAITGGSTSTLSFQGSTSNATTPLVSTDFNPGGYSTIDDTFGPVTVNVVSQSNNNLNIPVISKAGVFSLTQPGSNVVVQNSTAGTNPQVSLLSQSGINLNTSIQDISVPVPFAALASNNGSVSVTNTQGSGADLSIGSLGVAVAGGTSPSISITSTQGSLASISGSIVSPSTVALSTLGTGSITLGANIFAPNLVTLSTGGSGTIAQTAGVVRSNTITLGSTVSTGAIGASAIQIAAANVAAGTTSSIQLIDLDAAFITTKVGSTLMTPSSFSFSMSQDGGLLTVSPSAVSASGQLTLQAVGSNGGVDVQGNISAGTTISLIAAGSGAVSQAAGTIAGSAVTEASNTGNILQSGGTIQSNSITLQSTSGNIGAAGQAIQTIDQGTIAANTGGAGIVNVNNNSGAGMLTVLASTSGGNFTLANSNSVAIGTTNVSNPFTFQGIQTLNGSIDIEEATGTLRVQAQNLPGASTQLIAGNGNIILHNASTANGNIVLDAQSTLRSSLASGAQISIFLGNAPPAQLNNGFPGNVVVQTGAGGQVFAGAQSIAINQAAPANFIYSYGSSSKVIFSTGGAASQKIQLNGGVVIGASTAAPLTSLDLTDANVTTLVRNLQSTGMLGGGLQVDQLGVAVGGNVVFFPINIAPNITALNIPGNVNVQFQNFIQSTPLTITLTPGPGGSSTKQVIMNGQIQFNGNVNSPQLVGVFNIVSSATATFPTVFQIDKLPNVGQSFQTQGTFNVIGNGAMLVNSQMQGNLGFSTLAPSTASTATDLTLGATVGGGNNSVTINLASAIPGGGNLIQNQPQQGQALIQSNNLQITSASGNIGTGSTAATGILTSASAFNVSTSATTGAGSINLINTNVGQVNNATFVAGNTISFSTQSGMNFLGNSFAPNAVTITANGNVNMNANARVTSNTSINLNASGGSLTQSQAGTTSTFASPSVTLTANNGMGNFNNNTVSAIGIQSTFAGSAVNLKLTANNSIFIQGNVPAGTPVADLAGFNLSTSTTQNQFYLATQGAIILINSPSAQTLSANQGIYLQATAFGTTAASQGNITQQAAASTFSLFAPNMSLNAVSANAGSGGNISVAIQGQVNNPNQQINFAAQGSGNVTITANSPINFVNFYQPLNNLAVQSGTGALSTTGFSLTTNAQPNQTANITFSQQNNQMATITSIQGAIGSAARIFLQAGGTNSSILQNGQGTSLISPSIQLVAGSSLQSANIGQNGQAIGVNSGIPATPVGLTFTSGNSAFINGNTFNPGNIPGAITFLGNSTAGNQVVINATGTIQMGNLAATGKITAGTPAGQNQQLQGSINISTTNGGNLDQINPTGTAPALFSPNIILNIAGQIDAPPQPVVLSNLIGTSVPINLTYTAGTTAAVGVNTSGTAPGANEVNLVNTSRINGAGSSFLSTSNGNVNFNNGQLQMASSAGVLTITSAGSITQNGGNPSLLGTGGATPSTGTLFLLATAANGNVGTPATQNQGAQPLFVSNISSGGPTSGTVIFAATAGSANNQVLIQYNGQNNVPLSLATVEGAGNAALGTLSVNANVPLNYSSGALFAQNINLSAGGQGIASSGSPIQIGTPASGFVTPVVLTINTGGSAFITSIPSVQLSQSNVNQGLTLTTTGTTPGAGGANITTSGQQIQLGNGVSVFTANGNINISTQLQANGLSLTTTTGANVDNTGNITVGANLNVSNNGLVVNTNSSAATTANAGIFRVNAGFSVNSAGTVGLIVAGFNLLGSINAGGNTVQIGPNANTQVPTEVLGVVSGHFNIPILNNIQAGTLGFGSLNSSFGINLDAPLNVSGQQGSIGSLNVQFLQGAQGGGQATATYNSNGNTITLGSRTLLINVGGDVNSASVFGGNNISMTAGGSNGIILSGAGIQSPGATISLTANGGGSIVTTTGLLTSVNLNTASSNVSVVNQSGTFAYVSDGNNIDVINTATNALTGLPIAVGTNPSMGVLVPNNNLLFVTNAGSNSVSVINTGNNTLQTTIAGAAFNAPRGIAVTANGQFVYVVNSGNNTVSVINTQNLQQAPAVINLAASGVTQPFGIAINTTRNLAYVSDAASNTIAIIDTRTNTPIAGTIALPAGTTGAGLTFNPAGNLLYAASPTPANGGTFVIDTVANSVIATVGAPTSVVNFNPQGTTGYIQGSPTAVFNTAANTASSIAGVASTSGFGNPVAIVNNNFNGVNITNVQAYLPNGNQVNVLRTAGVVGSNVVLASQSGSINVNTAAQNLTAFSGGNNATNVFVTQTGQVNLIPATVSGFGTINSGSGNIFQLGTAASNNNNSSIQTNSSNVTAAIVSPIVQLQATTGGASIQLNAPITAGVFINLSANNNGSIQNNNQAQITTNNLQALSNSGQISLSNLTAGNAGVMTISANSVNNVNLTSSSSLDLGQSSGSQFIVNNSAAGSGANPSIKVSGLLSGDNVNLLASNSASGSVRLNASISGLTNANASNVTIIGGGNNNQPTGTGFVRELGGVVQPPVISTNNLTVVAGSGGIGTGGIGSGAIITTASAMSINTSGDSNVRTSGSILQSGSGVNFTLTETANAGTLMINGTLNATNVSLGALNNSNIAINSQVIGTKSVALTTSGGNITGGNVFTPTLTVTTGSGNTGAQNQPFNFQNLQNSQQIPVNFNATASTGSMFFNSNSPVRLASNVVLGGAGSFQMTSNGTLSLNGFSITAPGTLTLNANNNGAISQLNTFAGSSLISPSISLASGNSGIGSSAALQIDEGANPNLLAINSQGSATLVAVSGVKLGNISINGNFTLTAQGPMTSLTINAGQINVNNGQFVLSVTGNGNGINLSEQTQATSISFQTSGTSGTVTLNAPMQVNGNAGFLVNTSGANSDIITTRSNTNSASINAGAGPVNFTANGNIVTGQGTQGNAQINANSIQLLSTALAVGSGNVTVNSNLQANGANGINLQSNDTTAGSSTGVITVATGVQVASNNGTLSIVGQGVSLGGTLSAGGGNFVQISPNGNQKIALFPTNPQAGDFNVNANTLSGIQAAGLIFGSSLSNGGIQLSRDLNISGQSSQGLSNPVSLGQINLQLLQSPGTVNANYTAVGDDAVTHAIQTGNSSVTINVGGSIKSGPINAANANISMTAGTDNTIGLQLLGALTVQSGGSSVVSLVTTNAASNNNINLGGFTLGGGFTTTVNATASGAITNTSAQGILGNTVNLMGGQGIGPVNTNAFNLNLTTFGGSANVTDSNPVNLTGFSGSNLTLVDTAANSQNAININGIVNGTGVVTFHSTGANSGIIINQNVTGSGSVTMQASGAGQIAQTNNNLIVTTPVITLSSGSGPIGNQGQNIRTTAGTLQANTSGVVFITDTSAVTISQASTGGTSFNLTDSVAGSTGITISAGLTGGAVNLTATASDIFVNGPAGGVVTGNTSITAVAGGSGVIKQAANIGVASLVSPVIMLTAGGAIGASPNNVFVSNTNINNPVALTISAGGTVDVRALGGVNMVGTNTGGGAYFGITAAWNGVGDLNINSGSTITDVTRVDLETRPLIGPVAAHNITQSSGGTSIFSNQVGLYTNFGANGVAGSIGQSQAPIGISNVAGNNNPVQLDASAGTNSTNNNGSVFISSQNSTAVDSGGVFAGNNIVINTSGSFSVLAGGFVQAGTANTNLNAAITITTGGSGSLTQTDPGITATFFANSAMTFNIGNGGIGSGAGNRIGLRGSSSSTFFLTANTSGSTFFNVLANGGAAQVNFTGNSSSNGAGGFNMTVAGGVNLNNGATLNAQNGTITLLTTNAGSITQTSTTNVTLNAQQYNLTADAASPAANIGVSANNPLILSAGQLTANAGGNLFISAPNGQITLNGASSAVAGQFSLNSASSLTINTPISAATGISLTSTGGSLVRGASGALNSNNITLSGQSGVGSQQQPFTINTGFNNAAAVVNARSLGGSVFLNGVADQTNGSVGLNFTGANTANGQFITNSSAPISLLSPGTQASITASSSLALSTASSSGTAGITQVSALSTASLFSPTMSITAPNGISSVSLGIANVPGNNSAINLTVIAGKPLTITAQGAGGVNLVGASGNGNGSIFALTANGINISNGATVTSNGTLNFQSTGSIVQNASGTTMFAPTIILNAIGASANIGNAGNTLGVNSNSAGNPVNLTATAGNSVFISANTVGGVVGAVSVFGANFGANSGQFILSSTGNVSGAGISITNGASIAAGTVTLTAAGAGSGILSGNTSTTVDIFAQTINLTAGTGNSANIGIAGGRELILSNPAAANPVTLTANAGNNVFIETVAGANISGNNTAGNFWELEAAEVNTGTLNINPGATIAGAARVALLSGTASIVGDITQTNNGTTIISPLIGLSATGSVGTQSISMGIAHTTVNTTNTVTLGAAGTGATGTSNVFVTSNSPVSINSAANSFGSPIVSGAGTTTGTFQLISNNTGTSSVAAIAQDVVSPGLLANKVVLQTTNNGDIRQNGNVTTSGLLDSVTLTAAGGGRILQGSNTGTISTSKVSLASNSGTIGTAQAAGSAILVSAGTLQVSTSVSQPSQGAFINDTTAVNLLTSNVSNGVFNLNANGAVSTTSGNTISAGSLVFSIEPGSGAGFNFAANVTATGSGGASFFTDVAGAFVLAGGTTVLTSTSGPVEIFADTISLGGGVNGTINAGSQQVTFDVQNPSRVITFNGSQAGTLSLASTLLSAITAVTLNVGSTFQTGGINVAANTNVSGNGAGNYNLNFITDGSYSAAGRTITLGSRTLTIDTSDAIGSVNTGTVSGSNTTIGIFSGGGITVSGPVSVTPGGVIQMADLGAVGIALGAAVGGGTNTQLVVTNAGTLTQTSGAVSGTNVSFGGGAGTGNDAIGSSGSPIVAVASGTLTVNSAGNAFVTNNNAVTIGASSVSGANQTLQITVNGNMTTSGNIDAPVLNLLTSSNGNIATSNTIGSAGHAVTLNAAGAGNISTFGAGVIVGNLTLQSGTGNIGQPGQSVIINGGNVSATTGGSSSTVSLNNTATTGTVILGNSTSSGAFNFTASNNLSVTGNVGSSNGAVSIVEAGLGKALTITGGLSSVKSAISIQNADGSNGTIVIGDGATPVSIATGPATGGGVTIFTGGSATQANQLTNSVTGLTVNITGTGKVFRGPNPGAVIFTGSNTANAINQTVTFSAASGTATITLNNNVTVTADPITPVSQVRATSPGVLPDNVSSHHSDLTLPAIPTFKQLLNTSLAPAETMVAMNETNANLVSAHVSAISYGINANAAAGKAITEWNGIAGSPTFNPEDIVLFDGTSIRADWDASPNAKLDNLASDYKPIAFWASAPKSIVSMVTPEMVLNSKVTGAAFSQEIMTKFRSAGVEAALGRAGNSVMLRKGSVLFATDKDLSVETIAGRVSMASGSLVLIIAHNNGVAIYDIHDEHANDVAVTVAGRTSYLLPGKHMTITHKGISSFEHVNQLQCIAHRNLRMNDLNGGMRQFSSEFSLVSAFKLLPLAHMKQSHNPSDTKIMQRVMKDAAIIMHTKNGNGVYKQMGTANSVTTALR